jgi:hypothetical protein
MKEKKELLNQKEIHVHEFELSDFNKIVFSLTNFHDKWYVNIRTWTRVHPSQQNWGRTHKGIFVEVSKAEEIQEGINRLIESIKDGHYKKDSQVH